MLLRNSIWNVTGSALPAIAALASVPLLIGALGVEGYGIVVIVSSVIGYFAILDINMSAGAIKFLAESHASGDRHRFSETFWFGACFYGLLGIVGATMIFFGADWLVERLFDLPEATQASSSLALKIGALGFALTQAQHYLIVVPQALQRFDRSAQSEAFFGILVNIASVIVALAGGGIAGVIAVRVGVSALNALYLVYLLHRLELHITLRWPGRELRRALMSFSAYAYLSKLASTMHQHGDKLIIGALAGPAALTFYTVPVTLANRILGLTYRISSVIYPRVSALAATGKMDELQPIYVGTMRYVTYINLIALGMIILAGDEFLRRWVGEEFVVNGYPILILVTLALLTDSLTNVPSMVNDALGHPHVSGAFALMRGLLGVAAVFIGVSVAGITGAAVAHLLSAALLTTAFLLYVHGRTVPIAFADSVRDGWGRSVMVGLVIFSLMFPLKWLLPAGLLGTMLTLTAATVILAAAGIRLIVGVDERAALLAFARRLRNTV
jgi:O-antigen/teichoic acid export membrane protein